MAKIWNNLFLEGLTGLVGDRIILRRDAAGRTIICARPRPNPHRAFSDLQRAQLDRFREAAAYAVSAMHNPVYAGLAHGTPRNAYNLAISDWFHPPQILDLDLGDWRGQPGKVIRVRALDDVLVRQVSITILGPDGWLLETGPAAQLDAQCWQYLTTSLAQGSLTVVATAWDLPGHAAQMLKSIF